MGRPLRHRLQVAVSRQVAVLPPPTFPPSEGAQFPREIVPPSEGEFLGHVRHSVCSGVFLPFSPFPPSEGVQFPLEIVSPSEGESSGDVRHSVCSGVFLPFSPFPPSEGVQFPLEIPSVQSFPTLQRVLLRIPIRKVPGQTAFRRHLLDFVISRPASGTSLAGPAHENHPESAGSNGLSPSPSGYRYKPIGLNVALHSF